MSMHNWYVYEARVYTPLPHVPMDCRMGYRTGCHVICVQGVTWDVVQDVIWGCHMELS